MKPQLALAPHLTPDRLIRIVLTVLQTTPALLECDRASLYRAVMTCAQLGLEPDGVLDQAFLVPTRGKVQLVPGYRGIRRIAKFLPLAVQKAAALADLYESGKHAASDDLGEIVVDLPEIETAPVPKPAPTKRSRLEFAAAPEPVSWPSEGVELTDAELEGLFPPPHIIRILDAVVKRDMPEEVLAAIVGKPLDDVTEEDDFVGDCGVEAVTKGKGARR